MDGRCLEPTAFRAALRGAVHRRIDRTLPARLSWTRVVRSAATATAKWVSELVHSAVCLGHERRFRSISYTSDLPLTFRTNRCTAANG